MHKLSSGGSHHTGDIVQKPLCDLPLITHSLAKEIAIILELTLKVANIKLE